MHVFVHVYAMIITIEICFYIFIHNQDCPHMSCFLDECKCQFVFFWCLDPFVASVLHIMDISMRSPPVDCSSNTEVLCCFAVVPWVLHWAACYLPASLL